MEEYKNKEINGVLEKEQEEILKRIKNKKTNKKLQTLIELRKLYKCLYSGILYTS